MNMMKQMLLALLLTAGSVYGQERDVIVPELTGVEYFDAEAPHLRIAYVQDLKFPAVYNVLFGREKDKDDFIRFITSECDTTKRGDGITLIDISSKSYMDFEYFSIEDSTMHCLLVTRSGLEKLGIE
jgi:hypothetical protein